MRIRRTPFRDRALLAIALQAAGAASTLLVQLVLARLLAVEQFGLYAFAINTAMLLATFAAVGLDAAALRFIAAFGAREDWPALRGYVRRSVQIVLAVSAGCGLIVLATASLQLYGAPGRNAALSWAAALVPLYALLSVHQAQLLGFHRPGAALAFDKLLRPLLTVLLVAAAVALWPDATDFRAALACTAAAVLAAALLTRYCSRRAAPAAMHGARPAYATGAWLGVAASMLSVNAAQAVIARAGILITGFLAGDADAAVLAVAASVAALVLFVTNAASSALAPHLARLHALGDHAGLQRAFSLSTLAFGGLGLLISLSIVAFGAEILSAFGAAYGRHTEVLAVMVLGNLVVALGGAVGFLLTMTGHEKGAAVATISVAGAYLALAILLVSLWGLIGAAWAFAGTMLIRTVWLNLLAWRQLSISPTAFGSLLRVRADLSGGRR